MSKDLDSPAASNSSSDLINPDTCLLQHEVSLAPAAERLEKLVVIPQSHKDVGMPFARAYSEVLAGAGISKDEFLQFIDKLNTVTAASPPFEYLSFAGDILGNLPIPHAGWIGAGISAGAETGQVGVSLLRERSFIKRMNAELFAPRGLKVEIIKGKHLKARLGFSQDESITIPMKESISSDMSLHQRRLAAISHLVAPLSFDVPPPAVVHRNGWERMNANVQKRKLQHKEGKVTKYREKYTNAAKDHEARMERKQEKYIQRLEHLQAKVEKQEQRRKEKHEKILSQEMSAERRARKLMEINDDVDYELKYIHKDIKNLEEGHQREVQDADAQLQKQDREGQIGEKIYWIVVGNL